MKRSILFIAALLLATLQTFAQTYEYDANNQLTKVTYADGSTVTYTYDELGNRLSMKKTAGIDKGIIDFADPMVRAICVSNWDEDDDGELSYDEAATVTIIEEELFNSKDIKSFNELQYFTGLTDIDNLAFLGCSELKSIQFPQSLNSIGYAAFEYCSSLKSIVIPRSVTYIGGSVLANCTELSTIVVEEGNTKYDSRSNCNAIIRKSDNSMIAGCMNTVIPNTVKSISSNTFQGMSSLPSISIPNSVTKIGSMAFFNCTGLTTITIPSSVSTIDNYAFNGCTNLESVYSEIHNPFTIDENVFQIWDADTHSSVFSKATLYVPAGTRDAYLATPAWDKFLNIVEMEATSQGDVNGDGAVSIADVTALVNIILGKNLPANQGKADINGDGSVSIADVTALVNIILGKTGQ